MRSVRLFPSAAYRPTVIICGVFFAAGLTIAAIGPSSTGVGRADGRGYCGTRGLFTAFSAGVIIAQLGGVAALLVFTAVVMIGLGTAHWVRSWKRSCGGCGLHARKMLIAQGMSKGNDSDALPVAHRRAPSV